MTDIIRESVRKDQPDIDIDEKNIAFALVKQNGKQELLWSVHGPTANAPGVPMPENPVLNPYHSGSILRNRDSEFKILNEIAMKFKAEPNPINAEVLLYSEQKPCTQSCTKVIDDFRKMFKDRGDKVSVPDATWSYNTGFEKAQGMMDRYKK